MNSDVLPRHTEAHPLSTTPLPNDPEAWAKVSEDDKKAISAAYGAINQTVGPTVAAARAANDSDGEA
jgi:hypothetical protein